MKKVEPEGKSEIRKRIIGLRNALSQAEREAMNRAIGERLKEDEAVRSATILMAYLSFGSEVDLDEVICWGWREGKGIVVPFCRPEGREMTACRIDGFGELETGRYGIRAPRGDALRPVAAKQIDAILVPAVAFDRKGFRIGYGGGYYDRFLIDAPRASKIGVAFACQIVPEVPTDGHDIPVGKIVTETESIVPVFT